MYDSNGCCCWSISIGLCIGIESTPILNTLMAVATSSLPCRPLGFLGQKEHRTRVGIHSNSRKTAISMSLQQQEQSSSSRISDLITSFTRLLWGKSLPPQFLVSTVRTSWNAAWLLMMKQLAPSDPSGSYARPASSFRLHSFPSAAPPSLHLYAALPCPWAHRTLIVRALKNLERAVPVSNASPGADGAWEFPGAPSSDRANGRRTLKEVYRLRRGGYDGRSTVPMLWDVDNGDVFCNESYDIIRLFNSGLSEKYGGSMTPDLAPSELKREIDYWNGIIYPNVNNGVYRCGFAQSQEAYDAAVNNLFSTLDMVEAHLGASRFLCGDVLTLADVCLFTTLIRFDLVYNVLFKCTRKKLVEYPNLHGYTRDIYQIPKVAETCNFDAIIDGYYRVLFPLNPGSITPTVPASCRHEFLCEPHNRESLSSKAANTVPAS